MKLKLSNILVLFLLVSLSSSCASLDKYDRGYTHPYTATVTDSCMIWLSSTGYRGDPEHPDGFDFIYYPIFIPFFIVDLPFSIVTDTITFTI